MLGKWSIATWSDARGFSNTGILSIDQKLDDDRFAGMMTITAGLDGRKIEEEVHLTRNGTKIKFTGRVIRGANWANDSFDLELSNDRMSGTWIGAASGMRQEIVFQKLL